MASLFGFRTSVSEERVDEPDTIFFDELVDKNVAYKSRGVDDD